MKSMKNMMNNACTVWETKIPYEDECKCISYEYNFLGRKVNLQKNNEKIKQTLSNGYNFQKNWCICIELYKIYDGTGFFAISNVLTEVKCKESKTINDLF